MRPSSRLAFVVALLAGASLLGGGCKKKGPTCKPEEENFKKFRLVVQPELMNVDEEGNPRATVLHLYQLQGGRTLDAMDFDSVLEDPKTFFGDEFLADKELSIYPERAEVIEVDAVPAATHVVAVALFRDPTGDTWYREWSVPQFHGDSVCNAKSKKAVWEDPCFYLTVEGVELGGGHVPPPGFDAKKFEGLQCPGKPLLMKPPPPAGKKKKKKKRKKGSAKEDAEKAQEGAEKGQEGADKAEGASEAGEKVPGK